MEQTNVSSCVLSILSSFSGGLDVFRNLRQRQAKKRRSKADQKHQEAELRLSRSLRRGPEDIAREYERSLHAAGNQFAVGDAVAQTSLAEILLRLNTGLVSIIASFLDRDKKDARLDYPSLTNLSETSRVDTCRALRQLYKRMSQTRLPLATSPRLAINSSEQLGQRNPGRCDRKRQKPAVKQPKMRGLTLARVVIQDSSKPSQIAIVKPGERRKRSRSASSSRLSKAKSEKSSATATPLTSPPPYDASEKPTRPSAHRSQTAPVQRKPAPKPLANGQAPAPLWPGDVPLAARSTPRLHTTYEGLYQPSPPLPNSAPLAVIEPRRRKPTPTYYSIASDSTKIGEIPLHKWPIPFDFDAMSLMNREAELNGWPVSSLDEDGGAGDGKKKRFGLFRIFRRKGAAAL